MNPPASSPLQGSREIFYTLREAQIVIESWAQALQHGPATCLYRIQGSGTGGVRASTRRMAGCATPTSSAGHATAGLRTLPKLTLQPDHLVGAGQIPSSPSSVASWSRNRVFSVNRTPPLPSGRMWKWRSALVMGKSPYSGSTVVVGGNAVRSRASRHRAERLMRVDAQQTRRERDCRAATHHRRSFRDFPARRFLERDAVQRHVCVPVRVAPLSGVRARGSYPF